ncbi:MAG: SDR family oxidoreductase [Bacteroidota bacterium]
MKEKTVLVTGANSGIGLETARNLAKTGAQVVMLARHPEKGRLAVETVRQETGNTRVHLQLLDLASMPSIHQAAQQILEQYERIDVLINNAGLIKMERLVTESGWETVFGVNHLGPYLLTRLLMERMVQTAQQVGEARILFVSSELHKRAKGIPFDDLQWERRRYNGIMAYAESKLANILTANEVARRYGTQGIIAHSIHPGAARTNIYQNGNLKGFQLWVAKLAYAFLGTSLAAGAATPTFLATAPEALKTNGRYWAKSKIVPPHLPADEASVAAHLWAVSAQLTGL